MSVEHCPVLWVGRTAVVTLPTEIDIINADQIREDLLSVLNRGADLLVADLSQTTFCDSAGVSALARTLRRAEASQTEMRLAVAASPVRRVLALIGLDHLLDVYPTVTAALADLQNSADPNEARGENATAAADTDGGAA